MSQLPLPGCGTHHIDRDVHRVPAPTACGLCLGGLEAGELAERWLGGRPVHISCAYAARTRSLSP